MPIAVEKTREIPSITNELDKLAMYLANRALKITKANRSTSAKIILPFGTQVLLIVMRLTRQSTSRRVSRQILADSTQFAMRQTRFKSASVKCGNISIYIKL